VGKATYNLTIIGCQKAGKGQEVTATGTLTLTKDSGTSLVMDVSLESTDGFATSFGTYMAPSLAGGSTGKFANVSGAGGIVFGFGTPTTQSTLHLDGVLIFPDVD
jgi:hypothetical protein